MLELRPYQLDSIDRVRQELRNGKKKVILSSPTGSGKTAIASALMKSCADKGKKCVFFAHREELIKQTSNTLSLFNVNHGILKRGFNKNIMAPIQVAGWDSLRSWLTRGKIDLPDADLIVVDECHRALASTYRATLARWPNATIIGLTATPARGDGRGLGDLFDSLVNVATYEELVRGGWLVPVRCFTWPTPDLTGVRRSGHDYNIDDLEKAMDKPTLVGDIVSHWKRHASDRQTFVFATTVQHSLHLCEQFNNEGVKAAHVDGETAPDDRAFIFRAFEECEYQVLCNCALATEGVDIPIASACVLARPTKSLVLYRQCAGRVQRPHPESMKIDCIVLDHSGACLTHGLPDSDVDWVLSKSEKAKTKTQREIKESLSVCRKCSATFRRGGFESCPECGHPLPKRKQRKPPVQVNGDLMERTRNNAVIQFSDEHRQRLWTEAIFVAINRKASMKMAAHVFRRSSGVLPWEVNVKPKPARKRGAWDVKAEEFWRTRNAMDTRHHQARL